MFNNNYSKAKTLSEDNQRSIIFNLERIANKTGIPIKVKWRYHWSEERKGKIRFLAYYIENEKMIVQGVTLTEDDRTGENANRIAKALSELTKDYKCFLS